MRLRTFQCNGFAQIVSGFIAFGVFHAPPTAHPSQWQWDYIVITLLTLCTFVAFLLFFPDNPTTAYFLTEEEKAKVVRRVQENQNGRTISGMNRTSDLHVPYILHENATSRSNDAEVHTLRE